MDTGAYADELRVSTGASLASFFQRSRLEAIHSPRQEHTGPGITLVPSLGVGLWQAAAMLQQEMPVGADAWFGALKLWLRSLGLPVVPGARARGSWPDSAASTREAGDRGAVPSRFLTVVWRARPRGVRPRPVGIGRVDFCAVKADFRLGERARRNWESGWSSKARGQTASALLVLTRVPSAVRLYDLCISDEVCASRQRVLACFEGMPPACARRVPPPFRLHSIPSAGHSTA